jgi:hypothetical protein
MVDQTSVPPPEGSKEQRSIVRLLAVQLGPQFITVVKPNIADEAEALAVAKAVDRSTTSLPSHQVVDETLDRRSVTDPDNAG